MIDSDKRAFRKALNTLMLAVGETPPNAEVLRLWWSVLGDFPLALVEAAVQKYAATETKRPIPARVLAIITVRDGRPDSDVAWTIAIKARSEGASVCWTDEIRDAWFVAAALIETDEVGARMAFRAAYTRAVDEARDAKQPVNWNVSLGLDMEARRPVLEEAMQRKLISPERAKNLLPPPVDIPADRADAALEQIRRIKASLSKMHGDGYQKLSEAEVQAVKDGTYFES